MSMTSTMCSVTSGRLSQNVEHVEIERERERERESNGERGVERARCREGSYNKRGRKKEIE